jgi:hypothetical protein
MVPHAEASSTSKLLSFELVAWRSASGKLLRHTLDGESGAEQKNFPVTSMSSGVPVTGG